MKYPPVCFQSSLPGRPGHIRRCYQKAENATRLITERACQGNRSGRNKRLQLGELKNQAKREAYPKNGEILFSRLEQIFRIT
jgi:hypothetical protein